MRTTVDIPDDVYRAVKVLAAERGTTVRELVLEGLEIVRARKLARRDSESPETRNTGSEASTVDQETNDDLIGFP